MLPGCGRDEEPAPTEIKYSKKTAEIISHVTSGMVSASDQIRVTFVQPEAGENLVGSSIKKKIFHFKPHIEGIAQWKDRRTLTFKPNQKLPFRKTFTAEVRFNELLPAYKDAEPLTFQFIVAGREIADISGDFELQKPGDPEYLFYKGRIAFTESIAMDTVKRAVAFTSNSQPVELQWQEEEKEKTFGFQSHAFKRSGKTQYFRLLVDKDQAELSGHFDKSFTLGPLQELRVTEVRVFDQGKAPGLEVRFSDSLDPGQDITGLIRVEPAVKLVFKSVGKSVFLSGNFTYGQT